MDWKSVLKAERDDPRLWLETVWLVESVLPFAVTREIPLRRGLNIIWAQPAGGDGPLEMSRSGHGVGKSAFCQLLRYALLDSDWADERLREELKSRFPSGGVAARVHLLGETWVVYLPYVHQQTRRALRNVGLNELFAENAANEFDLYRQALQGSLVKDLPVKQLPADGQTIEWQHILPWCIRDQGGRFTDFFRWRSGRGVHLQLRAQSPPTLVKIILGVLQDVSAHRDEARHEAEVARIKRSIEELKRKPEFLKAHAEGALRMLVGTVSKTPFARRDLFDDANSVEDLAQLESNNLQAEEERLLARIGHEDALSIAAQTQWKENWSRHEWPRYHYRKQRATLRQVPAALEQLRKEWQALQPPLGDCLYGKTPYAKCEHILELKKTSQIVSAAKARTLDQELEEARQLLPQCRDQYRSALIELLSIRRAKHRLNKERAKLFSATIAAQSKRSRIDEIMSEYRRQRDLLDGKALDSELADAESKHRKADSALKSAQTKLRSQEEAIRQRASHLTATANSLAQAVFEDGEAFARFLPDSDKRLFELGPREAEAFRVLEILIADLACLLDSCRLQSHHPGLLVHDSPREAELSDTTFYRLMDVIAEIAAEWGDAAPFQYIVTTTHGSMRDSLHPLLRMPPLGGDGPESYLFGKDLTISRRLVAKPSDI